MKKILIIQTAFIGDVILATPVIEKLKQHFPTAQLDFLLRKGNESLLHNNPHLNKVLIWDKKQSKYTHLFNLLSTIRKERYDLVVNLQRFFSTGFITAFSNAAQTIGFDKNPLSFLFSKKVVHQIDQSKEFTHEVSRNLSLIQHLTDRQFVRPHLYPSDEDFRKIIPPQKYICIAPTSVWFTKQFPADKWVSLMDKMSIDVKIYLLGGPPDKVACEAIKKASKHPAIENLAGKLSFLESAALMQQATMNYVNDSAPLHIASAMNATVTAIFCSTVPNFGFTPLSDQSIVIETKEQLDCRPCNLHGFKACPKGHFKCADIDTDRLLNIT